MPDIKELLDNWTHVDELRPTGIRTLGAENVGRSARHAALPDRTAVLLGDWTSTRNIVQSVGQERLRRIRSLAGTGVWRTAALTAATVDAAVDFLLSFEAALLVELPARIAPTDVGGIMLEWE